MTFELEANPFEANNLMPALILDKGDVCRPSGDYSNGYHVHEFFRNVSHGWMKYHKKAICDILNIDPGVSIYDFEEYLSDRRCNIERFGIILENLYKLAKIPVLRGVINGRGNARYFLIVAHDEYLKKAGIAKKDSMAAMQSDINQYINWLRGA